MTQRVSRKWLVALGVASALAASPAFAAKDVVVAVGSNFTTLDPYDANDTLSQAVAKSFYQGLCGLDKEMKLKMSWLRAIPFLTTARSTRLSCVRG